MTRETLITIAIALALFLPLALGGNLSDLAACLDHTSRAECETLNQNSLAKSR